MIEKQAGEKYKRDLPKNLKKTAKNFKLGHPAIFQRTHLPGQICSLGR
jgi:hypothetical protein